MDQGLRGLWEGGRVWEDTSGQITYVIRRMLGGKECTRCSKIAAARKQLERFEADPKATLPTRVPASRSASPPTW